MLSWIQTNIFDADKQYKKTKETAGVAVSFKKGIGTRDYEITDVIP